MNLDQLNKRKNLLSTLWIMCALAFSAVGQNFECSSDLYQVVNGKELKILIPAAGTYETIGTSSLTYNGAGFNSEDGYIYGIGSGSTLVRVDNSGTGTSLGTITGFSALSYSGDFDINGNWFSFKKSGDNWIMNKIDVSETPIVAQEFPITELTGVTGASNTADIAYNTVSDKFYGMNAGRLIEFDPINSTVKTIADYSGQADSGSYGAVWSDVSGNTYFFNNGTGNIYRASLNEDGAILSFAFISTSEPNGSNDGMGCSLAQAPVFPEICDNGLDDDGDGLTDCEDPDCTSSASCGISGVIYNSSFACVSSIATYHTFFTNNSSLTNTITVTEILPQGFVFLQDTLEFDAGGNMDFAYQPIEGDQGTISWGEISLDGGETLRLSYDVLLNSEANNGTQANQVSVELGNEGTIFSPTTLSAQITVGECPSPNVYSCEPAFYQVYKKKGKNQPNLFGRLNPNTGDYDAIAVASDYANALGYDINSGLVYGTSGNRFIQLDQDGLVIDQGISFEKKVYRGDINQNSQWYGAVGNNIVKIDVSGAPVVLDEYIGQSLPGWDMAYNKDGHFYSIHNQSLYQFNTTTNTKSTIGVLSGSGIPESSGYGAQWTGSDGYLYASHNSSGKILRVNVVTGEIRVVSQSIDGLSKNDGFSCPTEIPDVFEFDYGDNNRLPESRILTYQQDISNDNIPDFKTFWLGNTISYDTSNPSNSDASGDLDDGLILSTQIYQGTLSTVLGINTNNEGTAYYLIGFDWDDNGTFDQIINESMNISTATSVVKTINVPAGFESGAINVRTIITEVMLQDEQISGDILELGEVEDYRYQISAACQGADCEAPTAANGGLESNGNLATAIAKRNYVRVKNNFNKHLRTNQQNLNDPKRSNMSRSADLEVYFPSVGATGREEVAVSSPDDLVTITNASDVFAVDYYLNNQRVAASLLLTTEDAVYNHSKNVCDRLNGKSIENVQLVNIEGVSLIFAQISQKSGAIEYSAWLSAKEYGDHYEVFSQWNVDTYPEGEYVNFQVWSSSPDQLFYILKHVIAQLKSEKTVTTDSDIQQLPSVIVKSGRYEQGTLLLTVLNSQEVKSVTVEVNLRKTEQEDFTKEIYTIEIDGSPEQDIVIQTGFLFDAGISLKLANETAYDALYLADGAWGTDFNASLTEVTSFVTHEVDQLPQDTEYLVERGFELSGTSSDVVNVFRNLQAGEKSLPIGAFTTLSFDIKNNMPIELILVEKGLANWEDRLRLEIPAHINSDRVVINLAEFFDAQRSEELDIQTIVFSYINQSGSSEQFEINVHNVILGNEQILATEQFVLNTQFSVFPNPATNLIHINVKSESGTLSLMDLNGRIVMEKSITTIDLQNGIQLSTYPGLYIITYADDKGNLTQLLNIE